LIFLVNRKDWNGKHCCCLNPSFNASGLFSGADADILLGDVFVEIKTVKNFCIIRKYMNQVIGYYILDRIAGINKTIPSSIQRLGIYFSRHEYLWLIRIEDLISEDITLKMIKWWRKILSQRWELFKLPEPNLYRS
jgi:hypothetical protein